MNEDFFTVRGQRGEDVICILERNLAELSNAILKRRALIGLHSAKSAHALDFFKIASHALYNDMLSHLMKVFDHHQDSVAFWWCIKLDEKVTSEIIGEHSIDIKKIEDISRRLRGIRNKTLFHIDKDAVANPKNIWSTAKLTGDDLEYVLEAGYSILNGIYRMKTGSIKELPDYDGSDAPDIIRSYKKCFPKVPISIEDVPQSESEIERLWA